MHVKIKTLYIIVQNSTNQYSNYWGTGISPHCGCQSPPLFVFLSSTRGTVFVPGTAGAHAYSFRFVIFVFSYIFTTLNGLLCHVQ